MGSALLLAGLLLGQTTDADAPDLRSGRYFTQTWRSSGGWTTSGSLDSYYSIYPNDPAYKEISTYKVANVKIHGPWTNKNQGFGHRVIRDLYLRFATGLGIGPRFWAGQVNPITLMDTVLSLIFLCLIIAVARTMRPAYSVYVILTFAVPLLTGSVGSMSRYILMLFPCFMLLGFWGRRMWVDRLVLAIALPLMAYFAIIFSHWYFAG